MKYRQRRCKREPKKVKSEEGEDLARVDRERRVESSKERLGLRGGNKKNI